MPKGEVHPLALQVLQAAGISIEGLRSKPWDEFATPDAAKLDFVFTVSDNAAGEACPVWPGRPMTAHWGIANRAAVEGTDVPRRAAFGSALRYLRNRVAAFASLPLASLDRMTLTSRLRGIGAMGGLTSTSSGAA